jgi:hypothetical protein
LVGKYGNSRLHPLAAMADSKKQSAQVLFHGAQADVEPARDLLVAAALHKEV